MFANRQSALNHCVCVHFGMQKREVGPHSITQMSDYLKEKGVTINDVLQDTQKVNVMIFILLTYQIASVNFENLLV